MKNYYETIKGTQASIAENDLAVPKGTELVQVSGGMTDGYAVKDPKALGACPHDSVYHYAYITNNTVFAARHVRPPVKTKSNDWQETANKWEITIAGQQFDYYTGSGVDKAPDYDGVLSCLLSDSYALNQTFENWADEYGYDADSRKAYATWEACCINARKLISAGIDIDAERIRLQDY